MFKKLVILLFSCLPLFTCGTEFEFSLGGGFQYSGVIGTQFAIKQNDTKYFVSVGLPGYSLGMQTAFSSSNRHSIGFSLGKISFWGDDVDTYGFLTYNHHFDGFENDGWVLGAGVGFYNEAAYSLSFEDGKRKNPKAIAMYTVDIGYKF